MLSSYPRHQLQASSVDGDGDEDVEVEGYNPLYGIAVICLCIFLFCVLAASVRVWKALAFTAAAALVLGIVGCFAPKGWFRSNGRGASAAAELVVVTVTTAAARPPGYPPPCALVDAPPAFAFRRAAGGGGEPAAAAAASGVVCSVCLEDVRGAEMVRQVPACRHIFHVGCIDMWLHSHRTCPMCRCVISPTEVAPKDAVAEAEAAAAGSDDHELPPV